MATSLPHWRGDWEKYEVGQVEASGIPLNLFYYLHYPCILDARIQT